MSDNEKAVELFRQARGEPPESSPGPVPPWERHARGYTGRTDAEAVLTEKSERVIFEVCLAAREAGLDATFADFTNSQHVERRIIIRGETVKLKAEARRISGTIQPVAGEPRQLAFYILDDGNGHWTGEGKDRDAVTAVARCIVEGMGKS